MDIVPLEGLDERLGHSVGLRAVIGGRADLQTHHSRKILCVMSDVCRAVVAEPLDLLRYPVHETEPSLYRLRNQIPDHVPADAPRCGHIAHNLTIAAVHAEGHPYPLTIPAG